MDNELMNINNSIVDVDAALEVEEAYQKFTEELLDENDYCIINNKKYKKKSAWRKYGRAFNIIDEILDEKIIREQVLLYDKDGEIVFNRVTGEPVMIEGEIISAEYTVRATLPNGSFAMGKGVCSIYDKRQNVKDTYRKMRDKFNNPEHDIPSTAHTRAKNRAISDLIGAGEVSAEEVGSNKKTKTVQTAPDPAVIPEPTPAESEVIDTKITDKRSEELKRKTAELKAKKVKDSRPSYLEDVKND